MYSVLHTSKATSHIDIYIYIYKALEDAGYTGKIAYDPVPTTGVQPKRKRRRRIIWFNPPYSKSVSTNIGKEFFKLLGLHFPKQHPFHRLFNDNTVKLSYSCMPNMDSIVKAYNMKIFRKEEEADAKEERGCNCRNKTSCPVGNTCLKTNVVYKATVHHESKISNYIVNDYEDKHEDTAEKYSKNTSDTDTKCSVETENKAKTIIKSTPTAESTNSKSASETDPNPKASFPTNSESMPRREFVHKDLYEEAINLKNKKELNKLLKLCNLKATGSVHDFRNRLLEYIQTSLANNTTISKEVVQELLSSLNMKGLNSEMKRLELPVKGTVADKREALLGAFCYYTSTPSGNPV